jgi:transcriptional regulator with XRE-family HTH domain
MNNHIVSQRFIKCHNKLRDTKVIKSSRQFAMELDYLPQSLSEILNGRRDVTIEVIRKATEIYRFNPTFLFTGEGEWFLPDPNEFVPTEVTVAKSDLEKIWAELVELRQILTVGQHDEPVTL